MERQNKWSNLPEELIEEILSRLPVKSLLRFRCVSKSWRSLMGSKRFIRKQLKDSKRNTSFVHQRALLYTQEGGNPFEISECSLSSLSHKPDIHALEFNFATIGNGRPDFSLILVGSCNGLVCILLDYVEFVLWNPSTRISKKVPNINISTHDIRCPSAYGFGCDDDYNYKVVVSFPNEDDSAVYSMKSDSWKKIRNPWSSCLYVDERGKLESGKLRWKNKSTNRGLEFDLKREVFEKIEEEDLGCKFWNWKTLMVYLDESSHVEKIFPSLAACPFTNIGKFIMRGHNFAASPSPSYVYFHFDIYLESLETLDT